MNGKLLPLSGILSLTVLAFVWTSSSGTQATTFTPSQPGGVTFSALAPGANPNITISFDIRAPSSNFSTETGHLVAFGDPAVATAADAAIPTGAFMGSVVAVWNLGLFNSECVNPTAVGYALVDAATPATGPPLIAPAGPATNLLANMAEDDGDLDNDGFVELPALNNGIADGADAYPTFLAASLDPDGPGPAAPIAPLARYFGVDSVAAALISIVQVVIMPPGAMAAMPNLGWMAGPWGLPMLVFVENSMGPPSNSPITDFCEVTSNTGLLGVAADNGCTAPAPPAACVEVGAGFALQLAINAGCPGGGAPNECGPAFGCPCPRATNPAGPTVLTWRQYVVSQRDWDTGAAPAAGDGHPNNVDPCPGVVNPAFPPDFDGDGIWDACDPAPFAAAADVDGDGWINRLDNCPLAPNPQPAPPPPPNFAQYDQDVPAGMAVPDGGPRADAIGPACDPAPAGANGHYHATALAYHICIGPAVPACAAALDADGDGVVNVSDNCISGANAPMVFPGPAGADALTVPEAAGAVVLDVGDTTGFTVGSPVVVGAPLETLRYIVGIDPAPAPTTITINAPLAFAHAAGAPVSQVMFSQSLRDFNASGFVDMIGDVAPAAARFGTIGGDPAAPAGYEGRFDLTNDRFIDIFDIVPLTAIFGAAC